MSVDSQQNPLLANALRLGKRIGLPILAIFITAKVGLMTLSAPDLPGYVKQAPSGQYDNLDWGFLSMGKWAAGKPPWCPDFVTVEKDKPVKLRGFITPLHTPGESSVFFVTSQPRGCYFCNPPGMADVVMVKIAGGRKLAQTTNPIVVYGTFRLATGKKTDESLYAIENAQIVIEKT